MEERPGKGQQQAKSLSLGFSQRVPYTAIKKADGECVVGLEMLKVGSGHPGKELDLICHLEEMVSLVGDSNCLGQMQLRQSTASISHGFRWGQAGDWMNLSFKPTPISAVSVCSMPRPTQSLEDRGWFC